MAAVPSFPEAVPEFFERKTKGGRTLKYQLTVLQQPERARACGSGSKSASDRRPVDPPPVVELRILEVDVARQVQKDITFNYNANFFLFATLEHARVLAHGRVTTPATTTPPVLTGMPVSGMAYLDRPAEAGYFLFPDLSVRHEGLYKLTFSLYEECKEEEDMTVDAESKRAPSAVDGGAGPSFDWIMEAKSMPFSVYSAKKFPGLAESTSLSRTVAEQGCRVRIRRDVRMRRRDGKGGAGGGGGGDYDAADEDRGRHTTQTPDRQLLQQEHQFRARSQSAASEHALLPYAPDHQRRPSGPEPYPPAPPTYAQPSNHLAFGNATQQFPPYQAPNVQPPAISPTAKSFPSGGLPSPYPMQPSHGYHSRPSSQSYGVPIRPGPGSESRNGGSVPPSPQYPLESESKRGPQVSIPQLPSLAGHDSASRSGPVSLPPISSITTPEKTDPMRPRTPLRYLPSRVAAEPVHATVDDPIEADDNHDPPEPLALKRAGDKRARETSPFEYSGYLGGVRQGDEGREPRARKLLARTKLPSPTTQQTAAPRNEHDALVARSLDSSGQRMNWETSEGPTKSKRLNNFLYF